jgi:hypothetical protein
MKTVRFNCDCGSTYGHQVGLTTTCVSCQKLHFVSYAVSSLHAVVINDAQPMRDRIAALDFIQTDCKNNENSVIGYTKKWDLPKGPGRYAAIRKMRGDVRKLF